MLIMIARWLAVYLVLGCVMESLAMILLTVPVFFPVVLFARPRARGRPARGLVRHPRPDGGRGRDDHTRPFGLNIFVINAMARDVSMAETYRGVLPFVASDVVRILIILFVTLDGALGAGAVVRLTVPEKTR